MTRDGDANQEKETEIQIQPNMLNPLVKETGKMKERNQMPTNPLLPKFSQGSYAVTVCKSPLENEAKIEKRGLR